VAIAMEAEAQPFVDHLDLKKVDTVFDASAVPFVAFQGTGYGGDESHKITVVTNGKDAVYQTGVDNCGTVPAALAVFCALQALPDVDIVINAGTCGGFRRMTAEIGNVFVTSGVAHHDRRIPIPVFTPYGVGALPADHPLTVEHLAQEYQWKTGICTTGNSLDKTDEDDKHMLANNAAVKDMEAAAIAWTCALGTKKTPFLGIKVVTDIVDGEHPTQDEFMANLAAASASLQEALPKVIEYLLGKHAHLLE
jgi:5'-methylthioadenosine nucleosidase